MSVGVYIGCFLPCPAHLSAPVTLTLTLSRRAGEGIYPAALHCFAVVSQREREKRGMFGDLPERVTGDSGGLRQLETEV